MESPNPASRRGSGPPGAPDLVVRAKSLCLGQSTKDTEAARPGGKLPKGTASDIIVPSGPGPTKAATAGHPGDRTPGNVRLIPICPTPDPAGGRLPTLGVAGRSPRLSKSTTRVLRAGGPRACAPAEQWVFRAAWRALSAAGST